MRFGGGRWPSSAQKIASGQLSTRRPKRTPWGLRQRIAALRLRGVVDADGGLWHRTLDELDACALAYAAFVLADGTGWRAGDACEGVTVLPGAGLQDHYEKLPPPLRQPLA